MLTSTGNAASLACDTTSSASGRKPIVTLPLSASVILAAVSRSSAMRAGPTSATPLLTANVPMFIAGEPMKPATKTLAGVSYISRGVPTCWSRPSLRTAMRSPMVRASVWSCVT
ncbi:Uncharacterised protein [Mycobacteroides abscessus]|nr:Uncharacterised protein [Mycobacteroides abscessus]